MIPSIEYLPKPEPGTISIIRHLRRVERALRRLEKALRDRTVVDKFRSSGENSLPMTAEEVGQILGVSANGVRTMVCQKKLTRKRSNLAGFDPDDVREYLKRMEKEQ